MFKLLSLLGALVLLQMLYGPVLMDDGQEDQHQPQLLDDTGEDGFQVNAGLPLVRSKRATKAHSIKSTTSKVVNMPKDVNKTGNGSNTGLFEGDNLYITIGVAGGTGLLIVIIVVYCLCFTGGSGSKSSSGGSKKSSAGKSMKGKSSKGKSKSGKSKKSKSMKSGKK